MFLFDRKLRSPAPHALAPKPVVTRMVTDVVRSGAGVPLDDATRAYFEPRFGHDFGHVRVHTDAQAGRSARAMNALAYTMGRDVVFGEGRYAPASTAGRHLLAHELAHVVQQRGGAGDTMLQRQTAAAPAPAASSKESAPVVLDSHGESALQAMISSKTVRIGAEDHALTGSADEDINLLGEYFFCGAMTSRMEWPLANVCLIPKGIRTTPVFEEFNQRVIEPVYLKRHPLVSHFEVRFPGVGDKMLQSSSARRLIRQAATAGVRFGGYAEQGPGHSASAYTVGSTVYVPQSHKTDLLLAISDYVFELGNAVQSAQVDTLKKEASKGSTGRLTANQFATEIAASEVNSMIGAGEIWSEMKGVLGGQNLDSYDKYFYTQEHADFKAGRKTKSALTNELLARPYQEGSNTGITVKQNYMNQYATLSGGR